MKWLTYLNERFPLQSHIPIIGSFTFSAICYSYLASGKMGDIQFKNFSAAFFLTISLFFLLRISDEFKDNEDDKKYRKYLPVPRGLVTLKELKNLAVVVFAFQTIVLFFFPFFLIPYLTSLGYLILMHKEFFIKDWLKKRQWLYVLTHMAIIPLVDLVASAAHWSANSINPPRQLMFFFIVSLFNGIILEVGRKIKPRHLEEPGVVSYTSLLGEKKATALWLALLLITFLFAVIASYAINSPTIAYVLLSATLIISSIPAINFYKNANEKNASFIEKASGLWTLIMYFSLGILPFLLQLWN